MKKLTLLLALCMILSVVLVACKEPEQPENESTEATTTDAPSQTETETEPDADTTTEADTETEPSTDTQPSTETSTEEVTTEPVVEPVKVVAGLSFDAMGKVYDGEVDMDNLFFATAPDGQSWNKVAEIDHLVDCLKVAGWVAYFTETEGVIGYAIDNAAAVYPEGFSTPAGQDVLDHIAAGNVPGAVSAARMFSDIPVADLAAGEHTVALLAKDPNGNEEAFYEFKLVKVDNSLTVDLNSVSISGSYPNLWPGNGLATTPALNATDSMIVLHYGSVNLGEIDLSKYSKVTVTYGNMVGDYTDPAGNPGSYDNEFNATQKRVMLTNTASSVQDGTAFENTPAQDAIITYTNYEQSEASLVLRTVEIDLSAVEYNGQTYLTFDFRNEAGAFGYIANLIVVTSIVFE
ncbi:MAG: hypothetical protein IJW70_10930 [Clostridia bacterium]|nr:hypothetical protein [Clostridia bacterium]